MSRDLILNKIHQNRPTERVELPENISFDADFTDAAAKFSEILRGIGGELVAVENLDAVKNDFEKRFPNVRNVVCTVENLDLGDVDLAAVADAHDLADVEVAILRGQFGVAENGAIWLTDADIGQHRVLPFMAQHLVLILDKSHVVSNMHDAYRLLKLTETGFGVFIAGPSKTADIEQSLVIGAHGARSLVVYLLN